MRFSHRKSEGILESGTASYAAKKSAPEKCITLKDQETVMRDQNQVAETMNKYFTNIKDLKLDEHLSFCTQSHFPKIHGANGTSPKMNTFKRLSA